MSDDSKQDAATTTAHRKSFIEIFKRTKSTDVKIKYNMEKYTHFGAFDEIHKVVLDGISENMTSLFQSGMYGAINTYDNTTNVFYVIRFISGAYTLDNNTTIDGQVISAGELGVKAQYLCSMQENTNC